MKLRQLIAIGVVFGLGSTSCENRKTTVKGGPRSLPQTIETRIVAGPGEKTFEENYNLKLSLPMSETEFLALLKRLGLQYAVIGNRAKNISISLPRHTPDLNLAEIQRDYYIRGEVDRARYVGKDYLAYVDRNSQVVYIENNFVYFETP